MPFLSSATSGGPSPSSVLVDVSNRRGPEISQPDDDPDERVLLESLAKLFGGGGRSLSNWDSNLAIATERDERRPPKPAAHRGTHSPQPASPTLRPQSPLRSPPRSATSLIPQSRSWDNVMVANPAEPPIPRSRTWDEVVGEAGSLEQLVATMYGGTAGRSLTAFDLGNIEQDQASPPAQKAGEQPAAADPAGRDGSPPTGRRRNSNPAVLEAVPEGAVLKPPVVASAPRLRRRATPPALPGRGVGGGARWRWAMGAWRTRK